VDRRGTPSTRVVSVVVANFDVAMMRGVGESRRPKFRRFAQGETARLESDELSSTRDGCSDALRSLYRRRRARVIVRCAEVVVLTKHRDVD
jgi:hypothetical protein